MKINLLIVFFFVVSATLAQNPNEKFNENHGIIFNKINSIDEKIEILNIHNKKIAVFPKQYGEKVFLHFEQFKSKKFISVDSNVVKKAYFEILLQYCNAIREANESTVKNTIEIIKKTGTKKELWKYRSKVKKGRRNIKHYCLKWSENLQKLDCQAISYKNELDETIIWVKFYDFKEDPYNLSTFLTVSWIDGWHGWFETNVQQYHYNVNRKRVTTNEEL